MHEEMEGAPAIEKKTKNLMATKPKFSRNVRKSPHMLIGLMQIKEKNQFHPSRSRKPL